MRAAPLAKRFRQAHTAEEVPWRGAIVKYPTVRPQSQIVPKPCETARQTFAQRKTWKPASHQAKLKKKVPKPCESAARKMPKRCFWNLLNINKNKEKRLPQARQTFAQRKTWKPASHQTKPMKNVLGTRMRKSRTPAGFVPKPLRNRSRKNAKTSLLEPTKNKEIVPKPCETAARKMPKRCFGTY